MYYYFDGFKIDVFGYDRETDTYSYSVETPYSSKVRTAKAHYKHPDRRNPYLFPYGTYIHIVTPTGKRERLFIELYR
jgi:hypothetical protein